MMICNKCKKEKGQVEFTNNAKTYKTCSCCRNKSKTWKHNNKERVKLYNEFARKGGDNKDTQLVSGTEVPFII
jgi:hypothetical protein